MKQINKFIKNQKSFNRIQHKKNFLLFIIKMSLSENQIDPVTLRLQEEEEIRKYTTLKVDNDESRQAFIAGHKLAQTISYKERCACYVTQQKCQNDLNEMAEKHDALVQQYNTLYQGYLNVLNQCNEFQKVNQQLTQTHAELNQTILTLQSKGEKDIKDYNELISKFNNQKEESEQKYHILYLEKEKLYNETQSSKQRIALCNNKIATLTVEKDKLKKVNANIEDEKSALINEKVALKTKINSLESDNESIINEMNTLKLVLQEETATKEILKKNIDEQKKMAIIAKNEVTQEKQENIKLKKEYTEQIKKLKDDTKTQVEQAESQNEKLMLDINTLKVQMEALESEKLKYEKKVEKVTKQKDNETLLKQQSEEKLINLEAQNSDQQTALDKQKTDILSLKEKVDKLEKDVDAAQIRSTDLSTQLQSVELEKTVLEKEREELHLQLQRFKEESERTTQRLENETNQIKQNSQKNVTTLESQISDLKSQLFALENKSKEQQETYENEKRELTILNKKLQTENTELVTLNNIKTKAEEEEAKIFEKIHTNQQKALSMLCAFKTFNWKKVEGTPTKRAVLCMKSMFVVNNREYFKVEVDFSMCDVKPKLAGLYIETQQNNTFLSLQIVESNQVVFVVGKKGMFEVRGFAEDNLNNSTLLKIKI
ncbi:leucine-rich repeat-containing protein C10orf80, putative [Entamoeba invadens IP1]|uniref:Leucine-rich repeat-containing protein C10orf80, putative n=1 Tax=Entamoeba invadens IP1 TaxID=370355 RepID=A0A0A1U1U1_ENTIV|nr:leucine-rich repeat-containing protein C10orf80, putative [Entamoeba invadens IP1]ELP87989.1 leucine-rich repeat-containing protein C10orf80, putative [Entamoeba invadens IP1]|eukprot:XP_004254760.1 leucine-rich repeat-containing protein C10orf80, putative [Entamoeba invadens IP1]